MQPTWWRWWNASQGPTATTKPSHLGNSVSLWTIHPPVPQSRDYPPHTSSPDPGKERV